MAGRRESSRMGSSSHVFLAAMLNTWTTQLHFKECSTTGFLPTGIQNCKLHHYILKGRQREGEQCRRLGVFGDAENCCQRLSSKHDLSWQSYQPNISTSWTILSSLLPSWLQVMPVSAFWLPVQISPVGTYNLSCASCPQPGPIYISSQPGILFCFMTAQT